MTRVRKTVLERQTHALTTSGLFVQHDTMNLILFSLCTQIGKHKNLSSPTESRSGTHLVRGSDPRFGETRMTSHHSDRTVVVSRKPEMSTRPRSHLVYADRSSDRAGKNASSRRLLFSVGFLAVRANPRGVRVIRTFRNQIARRRFVHVYSGAALRERPRGAVNKQAPPSN